MNPAHLKRLQAEWYQKLKDLGFRDIEDGRGNLKQYDRRTVAWLAKEQVEEFYNRLGEYIHSHEGLSPMHEHILTRYAEGVHINKIAKEIRRCRRTVWVILKQHIKNIR